MSSIATPSFYTQPQAQPVVMMAPTNSKQKPMNPDAFAPDCCPECDGATFSWCCVPCCEVDKLYDDYIEPAWEGKKNSNNRGIVKATSFIVNYLFKAFFIPLVAEALSGGKIWYMHGTIKIQGVEVPYVYPTGSSSSADIAVKVLGVTYVAAYLVNRICLFQDIFGKYASFSMCCCNCASCVCFWFCDFNPTCCSINSCWVRKLVKHAVKHGGRSEQLVGVSFRASMPRVRGYAAV